MRVTDLRTNVSGSPNSSWVGSVPIKLYESQTTLHLTVADYSLFYQQIKLGMRKQARKEADGY